MQPCLSWEHDAFMGRVYEFYDRPLLYWCKDRSGRHWLAVLIDDQDQSETFLYSSITEQAIKEIDAGRLDFRSAFLAGESYRVTWHYDTETLEIAPFGELTDDDLPEPGCYLEGNELKRGES